MAFSKGSLVIFHRDSFDGLEHFPRTGAQDLKLHTFNIYLQQMNFPFDHFERSA